MDERTIQHLYVMDYLCRREDEGGLGYRNTSNNIVSNDLFIPSQLAEFVSLNAPSEWKRLLKKYDYDEQALQTALKEAVKARLLDSQNAATFFNKTKTFNFEGEQLPLFYVSGTELRGDEDFKKNIFAAVEESSHTIKVGDTKVYGIRPDVTFFLNGIMIGYMELKCVSMGQNACEHGRTKVVKDYLSTIKALCEQEKINSKASKERKTVMAIYEKSIHLVASDINETYVMRGIAQFYDATHAEFMGDTPRTVDELSPELIKVYKSYPVSKLTLTEKQRFEEVMRALYSKKMIEKEILYYNFIEKKLEKRDGAKVRTSHHGRLIAPRPKQKFGCDKIMARVTEMLDHEKEPDYYTNKLRKELMELEIPQSKIEEIILTREQFCNNKYVYSLLMQYAAGFGKSNIIGWTALQLKDYRYDGAFAYDKIMLVVDRLQLRDQLDTMMHNMNIDKSMFIEATDKDTFIKALDSQKRIIVVNIQKFLDLKEAIDESGTKLKKMRVAFLIDEIHRSNSGENNKQMIDLFARLQESFNEPGGEIIKKNLLIGFTATPSDETLTRFGEFRSATVVPLWVPFDSYTMKEAIDDGYILDPTKHIIPYTVPIEFELPPELKDMDPDDLANVVQSKKVVYEFEPRMRKIAEFLVDRLVSLIYGKIRGEGKAMFAVSSVPLAIKYCHIIRELFAKKCEDPLYARYKDAPISIVYSDNQQNEACSTMNGGKTEAKVIQDFKSAKNGLMIVVDKLQTGFDEPKLHSLFLDKEINDINAIQTISRVNRTCKYKNECHVIDFSWKHVNIDNIKLAFKKYCDMVVSNFNPEEEAKEVAREYKMLKASEPYIQWFARFQKEKDDPQFILEMEDGLRKWIQQCFAQEEAAHKYNTENGLNPGDANYRIEENKARDLRMLVGHYASLIRSLKDVFDIDPKYSDEVFLRFWSIYCMVYHDATKKQKDPKYVFQAVDSEELPGITLVEDTEPNEPGEGKKHGPFTPTKPTESKGKSLEQILAILRQLNAQEQITAQQAQLWLKEIGKMFQSMKADEELCAVLKDKNFKDDEKFKEYKKAQNAYRLKLSQQPGFVLIDEFKKMLNDNVEQLYAIFMAELKNVENHDSDFDYDTTDVPETDSKQPVLTMEQLMELAKKKLKPTYKESAVKDAVIEKYNADFKGIANYMREIDEVVDNMFMVLNAKTNPELDGVGDLIKESLNMVCRAEGMTITDKRMHMNVLLMRYEGFLKKLYYMMKGKEIENADGAPVTLGNAIYATESLKKLKYNKKPEYQEFYEKLKFVRELRNAEAHSTLEASEKEIELATRFIIDMYIYATATNITDLEMAGFYADEYIDEEEEEVENVIPITYSTAAYEPEPMAADNEAEYVRKLPEDDRLLLLRDIIVTLIHNKINGIKFTKRRYWESIYRIAADYGFIIDGDYQYFKDKIDAMDIRHLPYPLSAEYLESENQDVYAQHIDDWTDSGLTGVKLVKYNDIKQFADGFREIVTSKIEQHRKK